MRTLRKIRIKMYSFFRRAGLMSSKRYMKKIVKLYIKLGIKFEGKPNWINPGVYFDSRDYSKIKIGNNVTISREVMFLTHDYSIYHAVKNIELADLENKKILFLMEIHIGENVFIGARASILPGTNIGNNSIIGAGAVVKGNIPENSIVIGNPAKVIGNVDEWAKKQLELKRYIYE